MPYLGEQDNTIIQKIMLALVLGDDGMKQSNRLLWNEPWGKSNNGSNDHSKALENG